MATNDDEAALIYLSSSEDENELENEEANQDEESEGKDEAQEEIIEKKEESAQEGKQEEKNETNREPINFELKFEINNKHIDITEDKDNENLEFISSVFELANEFHIVKCTQYSGITIPKLKCYEYDETQDRLLGRCVINLDNMGPQYTDQDRKALREFRLKYEEESVKRCKCFLRKEYHMNNDKEIPADEWKASDAMEEFPTNFYGRINPNTYYMRLSTNDIYFLSQCFKFFNHKYDVAISFVDSKGRLSLSSIAIKEITKYLKQVGSGANCLLISTGLDAYWAPIINQLKEEINTTKYVNKNRRVFSLGIAPYSMVYMGGQFEGECVERDPEYDNYNIYSGMEEINTGCEFIFMVDNGYRIGRYEDNSVMARAQIETVIHQNVPLVTIVDISDRDGIYDIVSRIERQIPTVVLRCDSQSFKFVYEYYVYGKEKRYSRADLFPGGIPQKFQDNPWGFYIDDESLRLRLVIAAKRIYENYQYIHFVNPENEDELQIIMDVFRQMPDDKTGTLDLMIKVNNATAAEKILAEMPYGSEPGKMYHVMTNALLLERVEIMNSISTYHLTIDDYLTVERLQYLYVASPYKTTLIKTMENFGLPSNLLSNDPIITNVNDDESCPQYDSEFRLYHINMLMKKIIYKFHSEFYEQTRNWTDDLQSKQIFFNPVQELFLWAILRQRFDFSIELLAKCSDIVFLTVFGSCVTRIMANHMSSSDDVERDTYLANADAYEVMAIELLQECTLIYPDFKWEVANFTKLTWNCFPVNWLSSIGGLQRFMGTVEMQDGIYLVWTNGLDTTTMRLLSVLVFPPLIFSNYFVYYDKKVLMTEKKILRNRIEDSRVLRSVNQDEYEVREPATVCEKARMIYTSTESKFLLRFLLYIPVLLLATYTIFFSIIPETYSIEEIILYVFLSAQFFDVIIATHKSLDEFGSARIRLLHLYSHLKFELLPMIVFAIVLILRAFSPNQFLVMKTFYAVLLIIMYLRIFIFLRIYKTLGPFLTMFTKMCLKTLSFQVILLVVLLPSGITQQALLFPNRTDVGTTFKDIFFYDFYRLFGELSLEMSRAEQEGCTEGSLDPNCPTRNVFVPFVVALYMLIANVFLINVLIALFSNIIDEVQAKALDLWKYNFLFEITQYRYRYLLPPPFTLAEIPIRLIFFIWRICREHKLIKKGIKAGKSSERSRSTAEFLEKMESESIEETFVKELVLEEEAEAKRHAFQAVMNLAELQIKAKTGALIKNSKMERAKLISKNVQKILHDAEVTMNTLKPEESQKVLMPELDDAEEKPGEEEKPTVEEKPAEVEPKEEDQESDEDDESEEPDIQVLRDSLSEVSDKIDMFESTVADVVTRIFLREEGSQ